MATLRDYRTVTMNEVSSGPARHPEGSIDAGFNLGHEVGDWAFFDIVLLVMFNPEVTCEGNRNRNPRLLQVTDNLIITGNS